MRMLLDRLFDEVARRVSPLEVVFDEAIRRAERIGSILEKDDSMEVAEFIVGGSCGKQTAIEPLDDADLFVYLEPGSWYGSRRRELAPATVLRAFEDRVEHTYRSLVEAGTVRIRRQEHSLRLELLGVDSVNVDVVPVRWDGNVERIVLVPDRATRGWRPTCIQRQAVLLDDLDTPNRSVRRAIRILKRWKQEHSLALRSYAVEIVVLHAVHTGTKRHPSALILSVLDYISRTAMREPVVIPSYCRPNRVKRAAVHIFDPAVSDNNVADNLDSSERDRIVSRAKRSLKKLYQAEEVLIRGRTRIAANIVAKEFGLELS
jgi:hypothetical protein